MHTIRQPRPRTTPPTCSAPSGRRSSLWSPGHRATCYTPRTAEPATRVERTVALSRPEQPPRRNTPEACAPPSTPTPHPHSRGGGDLLGPVAWFLSAVNRCMRR